MVVDDEPDLLATTRSTLEKEGYKVHAYANPITALDHIEHGCKDCVVLVSDIKMPEMSGFELVRRVKELRPDLKVIFTSSFIIHKGEFAKVLPSAKVDDFIQKPFSKQELIEAIKKFAKSES
jgi:two-component system cell cycle sensor histidine kinase/response regulator CckA